MKRLKLIEPVIGKEELANVAAVLQSGWLTEGPVTKQLEDKVRRYVGASFAVATTSCTTALELALRSLNIRHGDEVIVPDFTHPATGNVVRWVGASLVLVDVDLESHNLDFSQLDMAIASKTKCVIPVSWAGYPLNHHQIWKFRQTSNMRIVEDAACSIGAAFAGVKTGLMAGVTCFSFHPRKLVTAGEGGMIVTDDLRIMQTVRRLKNFGMETTNGKITFTGVGTNSKLSDIQAAVGLAQMDKIDLIITRRLLLAKQYMELLAKVKHVQLPVVPDGVKHTYQTFTIYIEKPRLRDKLLYELRGKGIEAQIGTYALHLQPCFAGAKKVGKLENSTRLYHNLLALPLFHTMKLEDQERVVKEIRESINRHT